MMIRIAAAALLVSTITGCVVYDRDVGTYGTYTTTTTTYSTPVIVVGNSLPFVWDSAAYFSWEPIVGDDLVSFEATVGDPDGIGDVLGVWADVYDDWSGGVYVATVELQPTNDPAFWVADVYNNVDGLYLDPYWGGYSVDFVVYDWYEDAGVMTVPLWSY
jgi:hypothetical protein